MIEKKFLHIILCIVLCIISVSSFCSAEISFTDASGEMKTLPNTADRIVCLNSDVAETMVALGVGDKVIGITDSTKDDTALMSHLPKAISVGNWQTPSVERILALKPDVVISYSSSKPKNADQLTNAGINLVYLDCYKINTLEHDVRALGTITGFEPAAEKYLKFFNTWKNLVTSRVSSIGNDTLPTVYVEGYTDYSAQGKNSGSDLIISLAKGKNLAADLGEQWPKVTPEWVISEDPDMILKVVSVKPDKTLHQVREQVIGRTGFDVLSAVKNDRVYVLNGDLLFGPRSPAGMIYIAKMLHSDVFTDIKPTDVLKEYADSFVSGTDKGEFFAPTL